MDISKTIYSLLLSLVLIPLSQGALSANVTEAPAKAAYQQTATDVSSEKAVALQVNINTASAEEIANTLKGIGLKKAQAIVEWRDTNGKFVSAEQLASVKGIGEKTVELNKDSITL